MARRAFRKCDKIFGPGNAWVTAAKQLVATDPDGRGTRHAGRPVRSAGDRRRSGDPFSSRPTCWRRPNTAPMRRRAGHDHSRDFASQGVAQVAAQVKRCHGATSWRSIAEQPAHRGAGSRDRVRGRNRYAPEHLMFKWSRRAPGCRKSAMPVPCSLAPGRPNRSATIAVAPITCCPPTAMHAPTVVWHWRTSKAHVGAGVVAAGTARSRAHGAGAGGARRTGRHANAAAVASAVAISGSATP